MSSKEAKDITSIDGKSFEIGTIFKEHRNSEGFCAEHV